MARSAPMTIPRSRVEVVTGKNNGTHLNILFAWCDASCPDVYISAGNQETTINALYALDPANNGGNDFQYEEVVRDKQKRKHMHAGDCECCRDVSHLLVSSLPPPEHGLRSTSITTPSVHSRRAPKPRYGARPTPRPRSHRAATPSATRAPLPRSRSTSRRSRGTGSTGRARRRRRATGTSASRTRRRSRR